MRRHVPGPGRSAAIAAAFALSLIPRAGDVAHALLAGPFVPPSDPQPNDAKTQAAAQGAQLNIGSNFLQRLGAMATAGTAAGDNSGGSGASQDMATQPYRAWVETYGLSSRTASQGDIVGDNRKTIGFVGGFGVTVAPGLSIGFSVDQSRTKIDAPLALQSATLDLTQLGGQIAYTTGPWTLAVAGVHGFASIGASRNTGVDIASANYSGRINGALVELNYLHTSGQSRFVPKIAFEYAAARTDGFQEINSVNAVTAAASRASRARVMAGAEIGRYWIIGQQAVDVSVYGKFVDNVSQTISPVMVSLGPNAINVQGIRESRYGADAGAQASLIATNAMRFYLNYDGRFRDGFQSHQGTAGIELKW